MTYSLKGFISNSALMNNAPGVTSRFGELSTHCRTFSKDVQTLSTTARPGLEVLVFSNRQTTSQMQVEVHHVYADRVLEIAGWVHDMSTVFNANTKQLDAVAAFINAFSDYVTNVVVDKLVGASGRYMPTRLAFTLHSAGFDDVQVVLWTTNNEFDEGYDDFSIVVTPPIDNVDVFLGSYAAVTDQLVVINPVRDLQRIEAAAAKKPPTHTVAVTIAWVDPVQPTRKIQTTWYALIYGSRGNTADAINEALRAFILSRSTSSESNWRLLMPDLFRVTRFLLVPLWQEIAITGRTSVAGIYSPVTSLALLTQAAQTITNTAGIVKDNFEVFNHPFRSLSLVAFAGEDNREDAKLLRQAVPDYIGAESTNEDFNRQALVTQDFSNLLGLLIRSAEIHSAGVVHDTGIRVVVFDGYTCLAAKHDNVEYIIRVKMQD